MQQVHRFTATYFDKSYLYWGTDDVMDGKAKFVRAVRGDPLQVEVLDDLENLVRILTKTPYGLVFISEAKHKLENESNVATIFISPDFQKAYRIGTLPDPL